MARPRSSALRSFTVLLAVAAVLFLARSLWLPALGRALVTDQGPAKADVIVVLGGDYQGSRILKAADRAVRLVDRERAELAAKRHDARMLARKQRNIDPAMRLVQKTR